MLPAFTEVAEGPATTWLVWGAGGARPRLALREKRPHGVGARSQGLSGAERVVWKFVTSFFPRPYVKLYHVVCFH